MSLEQSRLRALVERGDVQGITEWVDEVISSAVIEAAARWPTGTRRPNYEAELTAIAVALGAVNPDAEGTERPTGVTMAGMIRQQTEWAAGLQSDLMQVAGALGVLKPSSVNVGAYERPNVSVMLAELDKWTTTFEAKQRWVLSEIAGALGMWKPGDALPTSTIIAGVITKLLDEAPPPVGRGPDSQYLQHRIEAVAMALRMWKPEDGAEKLPTHDDMITQILTLRRAVHTAPMTIRGLATELRDQLNRQGNWELTDRSQVYLQKVGRELADKLGIVLEREPDEVKTTAEYFPPNEGIRVREALQFLCHELACSEQLGADTRRAFSAAYSYLKGERPLPSLGGA